jgi:dolichol kinase
MAIAFGATITAVFIAAMMAAYTISEYLRLSGRSAPLLTAVTRMAMRNYSGEKQTTFVRAPLYFAAGILVSLLAFPAPYNYVAIAVVTLGDGFASVAGRTYGRHKIPHSGGKTVEGTIAGIACAFAGSLVFAPPSIALAAALVGMTVEFLPLRVSDNLTVPLLSGLSATIIGNL